MFYFVGVCYYFENYVNVFGDVCVVRRVGVELKVFVLF